MNPEDADAKLAAVPATQRRHGGGNERFVDPDGDFDGLSIAELTRGQGNPAQLLLPGTQRERVDGHRSEPDLDVLGVVAGSGAELLVGAGGVE